MKKLLKWQLLLTQPAIWRGLSLPDLPQLQNYSILLDRVYCRGTGVLATSFIRRRWSAAEAVLALG